MRQLKRFAIACILIASLSVVAMADGGATQGPSDPDPGDIHTPGVASFGDNQCAPGETSSPPCATDANPGETSTPPGETNGPPGDSHTPGMAAWASMLAALFAGGLR